MATQAANHLTVEVDGQHYDAETVSRAMLDAIIGLVRIPRMPVAQST